MTLDQYVLNMQCRMEEFKGHWLVERQKAIDGKSDMKEKDWPLELPEGDWDEQFLFFFDPDGR